MGLGPVWRLRSAAAESGDEMAIAEMPAVPALDAPSDAALDRRAEPVSGRTQPGRLARPGETDATAGQPLGFLPSAAATRAMPAPADPPTAGGPDPGRAKRITTLEWEALEADMRTCRACVLCEQRKQAVPGVGGRKADWMLVGEGPGREEDLRGEPFVGQAGRLLDNMLAALGLERGSTVYIANAVKCRPPHNRTPEAAEIGACLPYLERQIELVAPRLLLALGRPAAQALLNTEISISRARGRSFDYRGIPVVVTYHPAYLLRNPQDKGKAWADLCFARKLMQERAQQA
jgi:DNA polymerase